MKAKEKSLEETLHYGPIHPHDTEKLVDELWIIMFSDMSPSTKEARDKLVAIYQKLKSLAKKEKKLKNKGIKKAIKAKNKRASDEEKENQRSHA